MHWITLLRHGESEGNLQGVLQGQLDYPLTSAGIEQAHKLAAFWKSTGSIFDLITSSPLQRASQTAEIIAEQLNTVKIEYDPLWKERCFGQLQGASLAEISHRDPPVDFFHPYDPIGGTGESQLELYARASQAIQNLLLHSPGSYLVVAHGGILNKALFVIMGITPQGHYHSPIFHFGNTGYAQFRYNSSSRQWAVLNLNNQVGSNEGPDFWNHD
jgi:2,3-bisphosphoglycerate-dependent phosphoglycerate mutase